VSAERRVLVCHLTQVSQEEQTTSRTASIEPASPILTDEDAAEDFCYLETTGRVTGRKRRVELWFGADQTRTKVYFLAGGGERTHWLRNIAANASVRLRIGGRTHEARGALIAGTADEPIARRTLAAKYQRWREGKPLSSWARESVPVALDLAPNR
jgi:deazaflavin-dependent oxidoreductase (nitroreductase family)